MPDNPKMKYHIKIQAVHVDQATGAEQPDKMLCAWLLEEDRHAEIEARFTALFDMMDHFGAVAATPWMFD